MHIVLFTHPAFSASVSMPRFTEMVVRGMEERGHTVEVWTAQPKMFGIAPVGAPKKWFGYVDQFIIFPRWAKKRLRQLPSDTLFVFVDHALGPWVPLVVDRPHVIHCHDFLAQRSAVGDFPEHQTGFSGRIYQSFIRRGYRKGKAFVSISHSTQADLHSFFGKAPELSDVVYNGYNAEFCRVAEQEAWETMPVDLRDVLADGFVLSVGGNQWYKNRLGVVAAYQYYAANVEQPLPLVLVGPPPSTALEEAIASARGHGRIIVRSNIPFERLRAFYNLASFLFFPSLEEGFGWPIAEAMACGCLVLTTDKAPMTEVGGDAVFRLPRFPTATLDQAAWVQGAVAKWNELLDLSPLEREKRIEAGLQQARRFETRRALDAYDAIYRQVLEVK